MYKHTHKHTHIHTHVYTRTHTHTIKAQYCHCLKCSGHVEKNLSSPPPYLTLYCQWPLYHPYLCTTLTSVHTHIQITPLQWHTSEPASPTYICMLYILLGIINPALLSSLNIIIIIDLFPVISPSNVQTRSNRKETWRKTTEVMDG